MSAPARPSFLRNVMTMLTGTVVAQAIPMLAAPVLTRLYAPADYGEYAAFMLVATALSALASARLELAIMLPEKEHEAASLLVLCLLIAGGVSLVLFLVVLFAGDGLPEAFAGSKIGDAVRLLAPMIALQSGFQVLNYWLLRKQRFRLLSISRVFRALAIAGANIAFGLLLVPRGLVFSTLIGQTVATGILAGQVAYEDRVALKGFDFKLARRLAVLHREFPLFSLPAELLSTLAGQLPVMLLDKATGGLFAFVQMVVNAPLSFVSGAVFDAFKERATRDYREQGTFRPIFTKLAKTLVLLGIAPLLVLVLFGPPLFALVFGEAWRMGGEVARILAAMYFLKLLASPLSYAFNVVGRQREDFILHIWIACSTFGVLWWGRTEGLASLAMMGLYSVNYCVIYVITFLRSYQFSGLRNPAASGPGASP